ncbi:MAG TPA: hypothetical protein VHF22_11625, partial [Planctomycetota bacterium]|nr:hypothetical protein [Planctomycetota bacterium]
LPFRSETPTGYYGQHIAVPPPPIRKVRPEGKFSEALERLVLRALEKEPPRRFQSADEMIDAIDALLGTPPGRAVTPYPAFLPARGASGAAIPTPTPMTPTHPTPASVHASRAATAAGPLDRALLRVEGGGQAAKVFLFALDRVPFGRSRPKAGGPDENALVLWLRPARSEREDPENFRATLELSGRHGDFFFKDGAAWIVDRSSRGTTLDGAPLPKGEPRRLPERFRLALAGVLELEGRALGPQGSGGVVLRRVRNAEHHVYALLRGPASGLPCLPEDAAVAPRPGGGFELRHAGKATALELGQEVALGEAAARLERLDEAQMRVF